MYLLISYSEKKEQSSKLILKLSNRFYFYCNRLVGLELSGNIPNMIPKLPLSSKIEYFYWGFTKNLPNILNVL